MEKEKVSDTLLIIVAAIWGFNFVAMKFLLIEISPVNLILIRFVSGSIFLFLLLFFFEDVKMPLKDFFRLCILGLFGIAFYQFAFVYAIMLTSVTNTSIIINTAPLYVGILGSVFGYEKFSAKKLIVLIAGFFGVYIIITKGGFRLDAADMKGNMLAIGASILWALYTLLSKPLLSRHSPLKVTAFSMAAGTLFLFPLIPSFFKPEEILKLSFAGWLYLFFAVVFSIVVAFFLWYRGVSKIGPSRTIIYQYAVPVFAAFFAYLLLKEKLYISQLLGTVIVFVSIALSRKTQ